MTRVRITVEDALLGDVEVEKDDQSAHGAKTASDARSNSSCPRSSPRSTTHTNSAPVQKRTPMTDNIPGTDVAVHADAPRTTELAIRPDQSRFDDTQIAALRALGVENAPKGDVDLLFHQSVRLGLDPFAKQIYLIGRDERKNINGQWQTVGTKYTIQTGIDGFRVVRDRTKLYDGQELAWCGPDGIWADVWTKPQPPVAARVLVYVKGRSRPEPGIAYFTEYAQTDKNGNPQAMWKKMPAGQLAKCAEALALRKAFPQDLSGVYVDEEMQQADIGTDGVPSVTSVPPRRVEQDHDGPAVIATMRETIDEVGIAEEWAIKAARATNVTDARDLYREANRRGFLAYATKGGEFIGDILKARGETLAAEEAQAQAAEPDVQEPTLAGPEGVYNDEPLY